MEVGLQRKTQGKKEGAASWMNRRQRPCASRLLVLIHLFPTGLCPTPSEMRKIPALVSTPLGSPLRRRTRPHIVAPTPDHHHIPAHTAPLLCVHGSPVAPAMLALAPVLSIPGYR